MSQWKVCKNHNDQNKGSPKQWPKLHEGSPYLIRRGCCGYNKTIMCQDDL